MIESRFLELEKKIHLLSTEQDPYEAEFSIRRQQLIQASLEGLDVALRERLMTELNGYGPLSTLLDEPDLTEILLNGPRSIWIERQGQLQLHSDHFLSSNSYEKILEKICLEAGALPTLESPARNGSWRQFRLHAIKAPICQPALMLSLRKHPQISWTLNRLEESSWCSRFEADLIRKMIEERRNFLIIGATGTGKTSVINALLAEIPAHQRCGVIEDTDEINCAHGASYKLLTRDGTTTGLPPLDQGALVRESLRMRPDRLVMGEMRGPEAKDFLMALSTGHSGSFGTLHAEDPAQALIRLEMLIQMGAPHWSLSAIRKLIRMSLDMILVTSKNEIGQRRLRGIYRLTSLEETGFLLESAIPES